MGVLLLLLPTILPLSTAFFAVLTAQKRAASGFFSALTASIDLRRLLGQVFSLRRVGLPYRFVVLGREGFDIENVFDFFC